jgi:hypothetical protein
MKGRRETVNCGESLDQIEHCPECGRPWPHDEPVHYGDCRYYIFQEESEEESGCGFPPCVGGMPAADVKQELGETVSRAD